MHGWGAMAWELACEWAQVTATKNAELWEGVSSEGSGFSLVHTKSQVQISHSVGVPA